MILNRDILKHAKKKKKIPNLCKENAVKDKRSTKICKNYVYTLHTTI